MKTREQDFQNGRLMARSILEILKSQNHIWICENNFCQSYNPYTKTKEIIVTKKLTIDGLLYKFTLQQIVQCADTKFSRYFKMAQKHEGFKRLYKSYIGSGIVWEYTYSTINHDTVVLLIQTNVEKARHKKHGPQYYYTNIEMVIVS